MQKGAGWPAVATSLPSPPTTPKSPHAQPQRLRSRSNSLPSKFHEIHLVEVAHEELSDTASNAPTVISHSGSSRLDAILSEIDHTIHEIAVLETGGGDEEMEDFLSYYAAAPTPTPPLPPPDVKTPLLLPSQPVVASPVMSTTSLPKGPPPNGPLPPPPTSADPYPPRRYVTVQHKTLHHPQYITNLSTGDVVITDPYASSNPDLYLTQLVAALDADASKAMFFKPLPQSQYTHVPPANQTQHQHNQHMAYMAYMAAHPASPSSRQPAAAPIDPKTNTHESWGLSDAPPRPVGRHPRHDLEPILTNSPSRRNSDSQLSVHSTRSPFTGVSFLSLTPPPSDGAHAARRSTHSASSGKSNSEKAVFLVRGGGRFVTRGKSAPTGPSQVAYPLTPTNGGAGFIPSSPRSHPDNLSIRSVASSSSHGGDCASFMSGSNGGGSTGPGSGPKMMAVPIAADLPPELRIDTASVAAVATAAAAKRKVFMVRGGVRGGRQAPDVNKMVMLKTVAGAGDAGLLSPVEGTVVGGKHLGAGGVGGPEAKPRVFMVRGGARR
ncbi:hypothetical protein HK101_003662 [Irineochytrium annulatum]|nr:hypothetical protein HK101_003662 [Irineochytrium annulatum]